LSAWPAEKHEMVDNKHSHGVENEATRVEQLAMMGRLKLESAGQ